uniref:Uncharacterized protein n=1 Tax=Opuntia streptacantha TaxID=393608 RepID=A0A7C8YHY5_OPUST
MADLLHSKLFFNSPRSPSFCFLLSRSPHPSFCISRFAPVRRSRVSCSSPVLANLSPHSTRLHIISTAEQSDGSVVFKFGDASENSQSFENVNGSGSQSEVLGVLDYEHGVNHTKPELIGTLGSEYEVKFERESVSDAVLTEIAENGGTGVLSPNDSSKDENCSIKVEGSAQSNVDEDDAIKVENFTERKMEHQETVLESVAQEGELVGLCDSPTDLQSNGDSVEDEQDHNLISTVEIENSGNSEIAKHDLEANNLAAISDCTVGSVLEGASDSELVKQDIGIEVLVTPSNSNLDLITEKFVETGEGKLMAAVSASQLELKSIELQEVSGNSSTVESLERAASLEDSEIGRHMKHAANNDMLEIADTNSPVEASDTIESLENKELESNVNHVANEEHGDMFMLEASDIARSLKEDEHDGDVKRVLNEEDGDDKLEAAGRNSAIEPLDIAVSLDDDERDNGGGQFTSKEHGDNYMLRTARNLPTEASDIAVSSEDDEHDRDLKQVANGEDDDDDALETAKTNSTIEASDIAVSLEDDEDDNDIKQMANEVDDQNKLQQITAVNLVFGASDIAVSFKDDELDSNATQAAKEEDSDGKTWKMAAVDSLVQASDMAVCLGDSEVDINEKHTLNEDDVWAGLIEKPAPLEPEPILREEAICNSQDDFVASESTSGPKLVDEAAHPIIPLSNDVLFGGNSSEAAPAEASGLSLAEDNVDRGR